MMKKIALPEQQQILLDIAIELDRICTKHQIPYYMIGGTMLGAIRHHGFIPWDDDMDFAIPYRYYDMFYDIMELELSEHYEICSFENCNSVYFPYYKIADKRTILDDKQIPLPTSKKIGINIDIFPLFPCTKNDPLYRKMDILEAIGAKIYTNSRNKSKVVSSIKYTLRKLCPYPITWFVKKRLDLAKKVKYGSYWGNLFGRWKIKEICPIEWYGRFDRYQFEGHCFCGIKEYDKYLTQLYGEYMKCPPKEKQFTHSEASYWKD